MWKANLKKVLFIVGTHNQTTMMHKIYGHLKDEYDCFFSPFYTEDWLQKMESYGLLENTLMGSKARSKNFDYFKEHGLKHDYKAEKNNYDLIYTCQDVSIPDNIRNKKTILVQEGNLMPADWRYYLVKGAGLPRGLADTSMTGLSHAYDHLCVASEGFKQEFVRRGVRPEKIKVTGIPNFDNVSKYYRNDFPHRNYVLVVTSDLRESFRYENRIKFIQRATKIASGRQLIFKLHPNENHSRAIREIKRYAPESLIYTKGSAEEMVAKCDVLIGAYSSLLLTAVAMGKEVHSKMDLAELKKLAPVQNNGQSAITIAQLGKNLLENQKNQKVKFQAA